MTAAMLRANDMRRKIAAELKGESQAEQIRIIEGYVSDWPTNLRGEYVEMRRSLVRRLEKLRTSSRVTASIGAASDDPFVISKTGHLTTVLVGLPNVGKSYIFHRLGGPAEAIADYPFSTTVPAAHVATLDNLSVQIVDLPPIVEGAVGGLTYGEKLRPILGQADVVCIVLDESGDAESQELVIASELDSLGVKPEAPLVLLKNRASEETDTGSAVGADILAATVVRLSSDRDFDDVLAQVARAAGYILALAKPPGRPADEAGRLWVKRGATVADLAATVHKDLARRLTGARVWGESARQPGQTVSTDHRLSDGDMVELLTR